MYLSIITAIGIIGATPAILMLVYIFKNNFSRRYINGDHEVNLNNLIQMLTVFEIVESIFEGFQPFGPSTVTFIFWILSGYKFGLIQKKKLINLKRYK